MPRLEGILQGEETDGNFHGNITSFLMEDVSKVRNTLDGNQKSGEV